MWLPSVMQEVSSGGRCDRVRSCVRPQCAAFFKPRGRYGDQRISSQSTFRARWLYVSNWFRRSGSIDHAPIQVVVFSHLLTELDFEGQRILHCLGQGRISIVFHFCEHGPNPSRHLVCQSDSNKHSWLSRQHPRKPATRLGRFAACPIHPCHCAYD